MPGRRDGAVHERSAAAALLRHRVLLLLFLPPPTVAAGSGPDGARPCRRTLCHSSVCGPGCARLRPWRRASRPLRWPPALLASDAPSPVFLPLLGRCSLHDGEQAGAQAKPSLAES